MEALNQENKERIRTMEEEGEVSYWEVLFKANSFSDLLDRLNMVEEIAASDKRRLQELSDAANKVEEAQAELETEKGELETTKKDLDDTQAEMNEKNKESEACLLYTSGAAQVGNLTLADPLQGIAVDVDSAGGGLQLAGDQLDDGGLTGTGRTDQEAELAVLDLHGNAVKGFVTLRIGFYNISKFNHIRIFLPS